jgi:hypothetical protein
LTTDGTSSWCSGSPAFFQQASRLHHGEMPAPGPIPPLSPFYDRACATRRRTRRAENRGLRAPQAPPIETTLPHCGGGEGDQVSKNTFPIAILWKEGGPGPRGKQASAFEENAFFRHFICLKKTLLELFDFAKKSARMRKSTFKNRAVAVFICAVRAQRHTWGIRPLRGSFLLAV